MTEKLNLVPAIREVEAQIQKMEYDFNSKIKPYKESLAALRRANEVCEQCNGEGKVLRHRVCAEDDTPNPNDPRDYNTCNVCHGTGLAPKNKER